MSKITPYTEEQLVPVYLRIKRDHASYKELAAEFKTTYSTIAGMAKTLNKYWANPDYAKNVMVFNKNHINAVRKVRALMGLPANERIPSEEKGKEMPETAPKSSGQLSVETIIKIIYLRKKQNRTFKQISLQLGPNEVTVWSCMNSIDQRYWSVDPATIQEYNERYLHAVLAAKTMFVAEKDPFVDNITDIVNDAKVQLHDLQKTKDGDAEIREPQPEAFRSDAPLPPPIPDANDVPDTDLFGQFEREMIGSITAFVTKLVKQKQQAVVLENKKLGEENAQLKKRNEELTRKLLSQKQSSLADSLKSSFKQI